MEVEALDIFLQPTEASGNSSDHVDLVNLSKHPFRHSTWVIVTLVLGYVLVFIVGLAGNILVVYIVLTTPRMRTVTNYFITNLAVADLLVLVFCLLPTLVSNIFVPWVLGWFLCKTLPYVQGMTVCASVYSLVAISLDRYMRISFSLRCQMTKRKTRVAIVWIWLWSAVLAIPWLLYFELVPAAEDYPDLLFCIEVWPNNRQSNLYFVCVNLILFYLLPLAVICFCYTSVWIRVWRQQQRRQDDVRCLSKGGMNEFRADLSLLKMLIFVVFAFIVSWLPLYLIFARIKLIKIPLGEFEEEALALAAPLAQWLGASNSCINPIIYALLNIRFRRALILLLCPRNKSRNPRMHMIFDEPNARTLSKLEDPEREQTQSFPSLMRRRTSIYNMTEL